MAPLAHTLALLAMTLATVAMDEFRLDMAWNSFDDQYRGCGPAMTAALPALKNSEFQKIPLFARVWAKARAEWQKRGSRVSPLSSPDQAIAIMAYTMHGLYEQFNAAVREAGRSPQEYQDNFHFKTLHFLLTQALVTLRDTRGPRCDDVFWSVQDVQFKARRGATVRFGQFTSISTSKMTLLGLGTDTMFQAHTCHGVDIHNFAMDPDDKEVLIPPFETFEVTQVTQVGDKTRIQLRSNGIHSEYNCEWLGGDTTGEQPGEKTTPTVGMETPMTGGSVSLAPFHLRGLLLATTALAVATGIL